ncbi:MAG: hypothetical protein ACRDRL_16965 [Sciscionella sp.]
MSRVEPQCGRSAAVCTAGMWAAYPVGALAAGAHRRGTLSR